MQFIDTNPLDSFESNYAETSAEQLSTLKEGAVAGARSAVMIAVAASIISSGCAATDLQQCNSHIPQTNVVGELNEDSDRDTVLAAAQQGEDTLYRVLEKFGDDEEIMMAAVRSDGMILWYGSERIRSNETIVKIAVENSSGKALRYASDKVKDSKKMVLHALNLIVPHITHSSIPFHGLVSPRLQTDKDVVLISLKKFIVDFRDLPEELRGDKDIALVAIKINPNNLKYLPSHSQKTIEILIEENPSVLISHNFNYNALEVKAAVNIATQAFYRASEIEPGSVLQYYRLFFFNNELKEEIKDEIKKSLGDDFFKNTVENALEIDPGSIIKYSHDYDINELPFEKREQAIDNAIEKDPGVILQRKEWITISPEKLEQAIDNAIEKEPGAILIYQQYTNISPEQLKKAAYSLAEQDPHRCGGRMFLIPRGVDYRDDLLRTIEENIKAIEDRKAK